MKAFLFFLVFIVLSCKTDTSTNDKRVALQEVIELEPSEKMEKEGELALMKGDYFQAVYKFRNAIVYRANDISLYSKLKLAYEGSCKNGNEVHCNKEKEIIQKMELIQEFGVVDTSTAVSDSVVLKIKPTNRLIIRKKK